MGQTASVEKKVDGMGLMVAMGFPQRNLCVEYYLVYHTCEAHLPLAPKEQEVKEDGGGR